MTLIKCFTRDHLDNIAPCLYFQADRMILLGDGEEIAQALPRYQSVLDGRGLSVSLVAKDSRETDLRCLCALLAALVGQEAECIIDLTGGDEQVIMAVGAVLAQTEDPRRVRAVKYDHAAGQAVSCIRGCKPLPGVPVELTAAEIIALHGGKVLPAGWQPEPAYTARELDGLWSVVAEAPKEWNKVISLLNAFESRAESGPEVELNLRRLRGSIPNLDEKEPQVRELLARLDARGVIRDRSGYETLRYAYLSEANRYCTRKAGNVLEVKTLLEGRDVTRDGKPWFHDCRMSVSIDWDGIFHPAARRIPETRNEIDVMLVRGTTPLFISCKNGLIGEEELYKLSTVADRFAGKHAKKMLIATDLNQKNASANRAFIQRAWDMDVFLVTDAAELTRDEWRQIFIQAIQ